ncbi:hypothetical protein DFJ74DRAFT_90929 [Hyaloraphidium curvatum]|nr:hypothetical protein DFJ74DRAFT_90929 [Hyaloraphidium curvatum]
MEPADTSEEMARAADDTLTVLKWSFNRVELVNICQSYDIAIDGDVRTKSRPELVQHVLKFFRHPAAAPITRGARHKYLTMDRLLRFHDDLEKEDETAGGDDYLSMACKFFFPSTAVPGTPIGRAEALAQHFASYPWHHVDDIPVESFPPTFKIDVDKLKTELEAARITRQDLLDICEGLGIDGCHDFIQQADILDLIIATATEDALPFQASPMCLESSRFSVQDLKWLCQIFGIQNSTSSSLRRKNDWVEHIKFACDDGPVELIHSSGSTAQSQPVVHASVSAISQSDPEPAASMRTAATNSSMASSRIRASHPEPEAAVLRSNPAVLNRALLNVERIVMSIMDMMGPYCRDHVSGQDEPALQQTFADELAKKKREGALFYIREAALRPLGIGGVALQGTDSWRFADFVVTPIDYSAFLVIEFKVVRTQTATVSNAAETQIKNSTLSVARGGVWDSQHVAARRWRPREPQHEHYYPAVDSAGNQRPVFGWLVVFSSVTGHSAERKYEWNAASGQLVERS